MTKKVEGNFFHMGDMCQKKSCVGSTNHKNLALYYDLYYYIMDVGIDLLVVSLESQIANNRIIFFLKSTQSTIKRKI